MSERPELEQDVSLLGIRFPAGRGLGSLAARLRDLLPGGGGPRAAEVVVEEQPVDHRAVRMVPTAATAFVGFTARGPDHRAVPVDSFADFERTFGGLVQDSQVSYAVRHFFVNGGRRAVIVRTPRTDATTASVTLLDDEARPAVTVSAIGTGTWGNHLAVDVDHDTRDPSSFDLTVTELTTGESETFHGVWVDDASPTGVVSVVTGSSTLVTVTVDPDGGRPVQTGLVGIPVDLAAIAAMPSTASLALRVSVDRPTPSDDVVGILAAGEARPDSVEELALLVERRLSPPLRAAGIGRLECSATRDGALRLRPDPAHGTAVPDVVIRIESPTSTPGAAALLGLGPDAATSVNVGRYLLGVGIETASQSDAVAGDDGTGPPTASTITGSASDGTGLHALDAADDIGLLAVPEAARPAPSATAPAPTLDRAAVYAAAAGYCRDRRAMLLCDPPPDVRTTRAALDWAQDLGLQEPNAAQYFPWLVSADPLDGRPRAVPPSGAVAGVFARTDEERGVWKAPAGTGAVLAGVDRLDVEITDADQELLNPRAVNCLRTFDERGHVVWGARTSAGIAGSGSEWTYVPVRRLALAIEESLVRGTQWAWSEPNDETLWGELRRAVSTFLDGLFRDGALQGTTPAEAYFVRCDASTTSQADIDAGVVNVLVGFAPLEPAEFIIVQVQQRTRTDDD